MTRFESVVLALTISYALIGALLLTLLVYARLPWPAKAAAILVTSCFYLVSFSGARGLLGWSSPDPLPHKAGGNIPIPIWDLPCIFRAIPKSKTPPI